MNDRSTQVAALLHEAGETHHLVYRIVDGDDPDWASWYADWLLNLSELPQILGTTPVRSELVWLLVTLDKEYGDRRCRLHARAGQSDRIEPGAQARGSDIGSANGRRPTPSSGSAERSCATG